MIDTRSVYNKAKAEAKAVYNNAIAEAETIDDALAVYEKNKDK